eukprot:gene13997-biopygen8260
MSALGAAAPAAAAAAAAAPARAPERKRRRLSSPDSDSGGAGGEFAKGAEVRCAHHFIHKDRDGRSRATEMGTTAQHPRHHPRPAPPRRLPRLRGGRRCRAAMGTIHFSPSAKHIRKFEERRAAENAAAAAWARDGILAQPGGSQRYAAAAAAAAGGGDGREGELGQASPDGRPVVAARRENMRPRGNEGCPSPHRSL